MPSNGLIVIARIKSGYEAGLRATLNRIGNDVKGKRLAAAAAGPPEPHIDFPEQPDDSLCPACHPRRSRPGAREQAPAAGYRL